MDIVGAPPLNSSNILNGSQQFKIECMKGFEDVNMDISACKDNVDSFVNSFESNIVDGIITELITNTFLNNSLSLELKNKLALLQSELPSNKLEDILGKHFGELLHNRVGTPLLKSERDNMSFGMPATIKPGHLVAYQERYDEYKWAVIVSEEDNGKVDIMTRDNYSNKVKVENEFVTNLIDYPKLMTVEQDKIDNVKRTPDGLLETYNLE